MKFGLRPMRLEDVPQVAEIEREAFPTTWPPTPFKKELQNRLASYLVAWAQRDGQMAAPSSSSVNGTFLSKPSPLFQRWVASVRSLFSPPPELAQGATEFIAGYVGMWFMMEEAHLVAIAVREAHHRLGLGELLMQGTIELAIARGMRSVTLEARVSNTPAHALYEKYGFRKMGVRKAYYSDNREDAVIMTAEDILTPAYQEMFRSRVEAFSQRRGDAVRIVV